MVVASTRVPTDSHRALSEHHEQGLARGNGERIGGYAAPRAGENRGIWKESTVCESPEVPTAAGASESNDVEWRKKVRSRSTSSLT